MTKQELVEKVQPLSDRLREIQRGLEELSEGSGDEELIDAAARLALTLDELESVLDEAGED